jgi:hypothetical protein
MRNKVAGRDVVPVLTATANKPSRWQAEKFNGAVLSSRRNTLALACPFEHAAFAGVARDVASARRDRPTATDRGRCSVRPKREHTVQPASALTRLRLARTMHRPLMALERRSRLPVDEPQEPPRNLK